jgi:hypothetical protein
MNPADKLAAVRALIAGLNALVPKLNAEVLAYRRTTKSKAFSADFGEITFRRNPPKIKFYKDDLLELARAYYPHEVIEEHTVVVPASVRPSLEKTLLARLEIIDGEIVDTETGAVCEVAYVEPGDVDTVAFKPSDEQRALAEALVAGRVEAITAALAIEAP